MNPIDEAGEGDHARILLHASLVPCETIRAKPPRRHVLCGTAQLQFGCPNGDVPQGEGGTVIGLTPAGITFAPHSGPGARSFSEAKEMTLSQMLFSLQGRITRSQYWLYSISKTVILFGIIGGLAAIFGDAIGKDDTVTAIFGGVALVFYVLFVWMSICIQGKRCHDRNRSAWFIFISLIPLVGAIWLLIELGFLDGTQGENQYGPSPKGIIGNDTVSNVFA
jgi:uncharacterized membrane protein YhaH (DUF805 family)